MLLATRRALLVCFLTLFSFAFAVENAASTVPNSDPTYRQLRDIGLSGEVLAVDNVTLKRDAATFHLHSGGPAIAHGNEQSETPHQGK